MRALHVIKRVFRVLRFNYREIILFELIYRILFAVCVISLNTRLFSFAIKKAGYSYLTAKNLVGFFLHPWSIFILLIIFMFLVFYVFFEVCVLLAAFQASEYGERLKLQDLIKKGIKNLIRVLKREQYICILYTLFFFLASGMFYLYPAAERIKTIRDTMRNLKAMPSW